MQLQQRWPSPSRFQKSIHISSSFRISNLIGVRLDFVEYKLLVYFSELNIRIRYSDWSSNSAYDAIITSREVIIELMARLLS